jgi:uridine phosphorylase
MAERGFEHSNNPPFRCSAAVLLLPFGRRSFLPAIVAALDGEEIPLDDTTDRIAYALQGAGAPVTLLYSGMGGPAAANALEMAAANGGRRLVVFGACGGVAPELAVGDLLVVSAAVRGDGASRYYAPPEYPAACDPLLTTRLWREATQDQRLTVHRGVVFTTDASYRQGPEVYEAHSGLILGVECEMATVAVVGARLGLEVSGLLFCTDNVNLPSDGDRRYQGLADERIRRAFDSGLHAAVRALGN